MSTITVEVAPLAAVAQELDQTGERLHRMAIRLGAATTDQTGHAALARELDGFERHWRAGLKAVAAAADRAGDQLGEAVRVYSRVELAITEAAR